MKNCRCKTLEMQRMRNDARMSRELKERELIGKAKQGDKSALLALYEQYTPLLKKLCRNRADYSNVLDFDISMDDGKRIEKLESLFREFIVPFTDLALSRLGLRELAKEGKIFLLPAVKEGLTILS